MNIETIVLCAGKGTRMKSQEIPKVMHNISGFPMIGHILNVVNQFSDKIAVVVGHQADIVKDFVENNFQNVVFPVQKEQNGTGGAVKSALDFSSKDSSHIMIIAGDTPLLKKETFFNVVDFFKKKEADLVLVSTILEDAGTYGRLKRDKNGFISEIVEFLDATKKEREIKEINSGIYFIKKDLLMQTVMNLKNKNKKNEFYLTDIIKLAYNSQKKVIAYIENDFFSLIGVNSKFDLAIADKEMQNRIKKEFMLNGVEIINPDSVYIEFGAKIESDSVIFPNCFIGKNAVIKSGVTILPNCFINSMVKQNSTIQPFSKIL